MTDTELEQLASAPGGPEFSEADLAVPRTAAIRRIRRGRVLWRVAATAAAAVLLVVSIPEPKLETLALTVPVIAAPEVHVTPTRPVLHAVRQKHKQEQKSVVVKIYTDDPNIVIYWVTD